MQWTSQENLAPASVQITDIRKVLAKQQHVLMHTVCTPQTHWPAAQCKVANSLRFCWRRKCRAAFMRCAVGKTTGLVTAHAVVASLILCTPAPRR